MSRLRLELIRFTLRLTHKFLPKLMRYFRFLGLGLFVPYGIFNPTFTLSTALILNHVRPYGRVADLGCGSGAIAIFIAKNFKVVEVVAYDLNPKALATAVVNSKLNNVRSKVRFVRARDELLRLGKVDYVITNPPYLPLEPRDELDFAWCGGADLRLLKELIKLGREILREGGVLVTTASSTSVSKVLDYLNSLNLRARITASVKLPTDTIYLIHALKTTHTC